MYKIACIYALFFLIIIPWDLKHHSFFLICYLHTFVSWTLHLENCVLDLYNHIYPFHISFRLVFTVSSLDYLLIFYFSSFLGPNSACQHTFLAELYMRSSLLSQLPSSHRGLCSLGLSTKHPLLISSSACSIISCLLFFFCEKLQRELQDANLVYNPVPTHCVSPWKHVNRFLSKEIKTFKVVPKTSRSNESFNPMWFFPFLINVFLF